jgi:hypothetical protein
MVKEYSRRPVSWLFWRSAIQKAETDSGGVFCLRSVPGVRGKEQLSRGYLRALLGPVVRCTVCAPNANPNYLFWGGQHWPTQPRACGHAV